MKMSLHIDRLVLAGLPLNACDGAVVQAAIEKEFRRLLLADPQARQQLRALKSGAMSDVLRAPVVHLDAAHAPADIGRDVARSLMETLRHA